MKTQLYYSTDQVIEILQSMQGVGQMFEYTNKVTTAIIAELEDQRPPKKLTFLQKLGLKK